MHDVKVALHPEVAVTVRVNVARSPEEADLQLQGIDVMAQMFERDAAPPAEELQPVVETDEAGEAAADEPAAETAEAEAAEADTAEDGDTPAAEEGEKPE
jgi:large subunit ribosomal protein L9